MGMSAEAVTMAEANSIAQLVLHFSVVLLRDFVRENLDIGVPLRSG